MVVRDVTYELHELRLRRRVITVGVGGHPWRRVDEQGKSFEDALREFVAFAEGGALPAGVGVHASSLVSPDVVNYIPI